MKSKSLKTLKQMAVEYKKYQAPYKPEHLITTKNYSDKNEAELRKSMKDFFFFLGGISEKVRNQGVEVKTKKQQVHHFDGQRQVDGTKKVPSGQFPGTSDQHTIVHSVHPKMEIKIGRDYQSPEQKEYERRVIKAGGLYVIVKSFDDVLNWYINYFNIKGDFIDYYRKFLAENYDWLIERENKIDWTK